MMIANLIVKKAQSAHQAALFMQELLDSVESLSAVAELHGAQTLADLLYLQQAILTEGFIDIYPEASCVRELVSGLPSGKLWTTFLRSPQDNDHKVEVFAGHLSLGGETLKVSFQTLVGATQAEQDAAFMAALCKAGAKLDYLSMGTF